MRRADTSVTWAAEADQVVAVEWALCQPAHEASASFSGLCSWAAYGRSATGRSRWSIASLSTSHERTRRSAWLAEPGGRGAVVQDDLVADLFRQVEDVVEGVGELVDLVPVEWRDERLFELAHDRVIAVITAMLEITSSADAAKLDR
jgi:hypothetical protein